MKSPDAKLSARAARDDLVLHDERCMRECVALFGVGRRLGFPELASGLGVDRDHPGVEGCQENRVARDRDTTREASAAVLGGRIRRVLV